MKTLKRVLAEVAATGLTFLMLAFYVAVIVSLVALGFVSKHFPYIVLLAVAYMAFSSL